MDRFDSDKTLGYSVRSIAREIESDSLESISMDALQRIYLRGKLMVERRSDEWICLFFFLFFFSDIITLKGQMQREQKQQHPS